MLFLDGVYVDQPDGTVRFRWVKAPTSGELTQLAQTIARRVGRFLERQGLLERDAENSYLAGEAVEAGPMDQLLGHSITYRIAVGPQAGRKVFTLRTLPACDPEESFGDTVGKVGGFSLHAGVAAKAGERKKLERLCRYIARPAVSEERLSLTDSGKVRYQLKTPYRDGTTHVMLLRASCPPPFGPACGCSKSLPAILSSRWTSSPDWPHWCPGRESISLDSTACSRRTASIGLW